MFPKALFRRIPMMRAVFVAIVAMFAGVPATAEMQDRKETVCIVVHHSATSGGSVEAFRRNHKEKGWEDVGYHFVIANGNGGPDGEIQKGRPEKAIGAHAKGRNADSIGVCLVGQEQFTAKQKDALVLLLADLCRRYGITPSEKTIQGHHEKCPGHGLSLGDIVAKVKAILKATTTSNRAVSLRETAISFILSAVEELQFLIKTGKINGIHKRAFI